MRQAKLINRVTRGEVRVYATTEHPASSYGKAVWVDSENNAYCEVDSKFSNPFYEIIEDFS